MRSARPRKYEQTRRAEQQAATRQRIVEAIVASHREVGPASTTISGIAERAGVERLTVYRHFADEAAMLQACSAHFATEVAPPDPAAWATVADPAERLNAALVAFYDYYRRGEDMHAHVFRDATRMPVLATLLEPWEALVATTRDDLVAEWAPPKRRRARLAAVVAHALRFDTWRSLARAERLDDADVAELMVALARAATAG